jgi:hypothetical protein
VSFYTIRRIAFKEEKKEQGTPPLRQLAYERSYQRVVVAANSRSR